MSRVLISAAAQPSSDWSLDLFKDFWKYSENSTTENDKKFFKCQPSHYEGETEMIKKNDLKSLWSCHRCHLPLSSTSIKYMKKYWSWRNAIETIAIATTIWGEIETFSQLKNYILVIIFSFFFWNFSTSPDEKKVEILHRQQMKNSPTAVQVITSSIAWAQGEQIENSVRKVVDIFKRM